MYKAMIDLSANQLDRFNFSPLIVAISSTYLRKKNQQDFIFFLFFFVVVHNCNAQLQCIMFYQRMYFYLFPK